MSLQYFLKKLILPILMLCICRHTAKAQDTTVVLDKNCFYSGLYDQNNELVSIGKLDKKNIILVTNKVCMSCLPQVESKLRFNKEHEVVYLIVLHSSPLEMKGRINDIKNILKGNRSFYFIYEDDENWNCVTNLKDDFKNLMYMPSPCLIKMNIKKNSFELYDFSYVNTLIEK